MGTSTLIVGLGKIGLTYDIGLNKEQYIYSHARAIDCHTKFVLAGGVDIKAENRRQFEKIFNKPTHSSLDEALNHHDPQLVIVSVPTNQHWKTIRAILSASKPKTILCEKPLVYDLEDANSIVTACNKDGVKLFVNFVRNSDPGAVEIKRRISERELGGAIKGLAWYTKGFIHNGSHIFQLLKYWLGPVQDYQILEVTKFRDREDADLDVRIVFEKGEVILASVSDVGYSHHAIELVSQNGRLRYDLGGKFIEWQKANIVPSIADNMFLEENKETICSAMDKYQLSVVNELSKSFAEKKAYLCTGAEALDLLQDMKNIMANKRL